MIEKFKDFLNFKSRESHNNREQYLVLDSYQTERARKAVAEHLKVIAGKGEAHAVNEKMDYVKALVKVDSAPSAVICTDTSAVPYGYAFKEGLRVAFPDKELPKFLRINVKPFAFFTRFFTGRDDFRDDIKQLWYGRRDHINKTEQEFFQIFNEGYQIAEQSFNNSVKQWEEKLEKLKLQDKNLFIFDERIISGDTIRSVFYLLYKAGVSLQNMFLIPLTKWSVGNVDVTQKYNPIKSYYNHSAIPKNFQGGVRGVPDKVRVAKRGKEIERAKKLVHDMRLLGQEAGLALRQELN